MSSNLSPIIAIDEEKCTNCHTCVSVCPVKFANNASGSIVNIDAERCIGCGQCIKACTHDARVGIDDMMPFMNSLNRGSQVVAIVAPAIAARFPNQYKKFNGWLKSLGVAASFDVSFGAELTIKSYLSHIENNNPQTVIAQPCPALVNYIELYKPNLIKHLAPADSPMVHTIKMVKEYYPEFTRAKFAVISPCYAKKHEFEMTGQGDFNVTFSSILDYMERNEIVLNRYPEVEYVNPPAERGVLFSTPGGLLRTARRWSEDIESITRKIEGPEIVYPYLDELEEAIKNGTAPKIVDCLNCEHGCNGGTATSNQHAHLDCIENPIEQRAVTHIDHHKKSGLLARKREKKELKQLINTHWKPALYNRSYSDRSHLNRIKKPHPTELKQVYESMYKYNQSDLYNCVSCGYNSCEKMAEAIVNGLNRPENCHHFLKKTTELEHNKSLDQQRQIEEAHSEISVIINRAKEQNLELTENVKEILDSLLDTVVEQKRAFEEFMSEIKSSYTIVENFKPIAQAIQDIATETDLLSVNASIEAVRAGQYGRSFSVVANEVKKLATNSKLEAEKIEPYLNSLYKTFNQISNKADETIKCTENTAKLSDDIRALVDRIQDTTNSFEQDFRI